MMHNFGRAQQINIQNYIEGFRKSTRTEAKNETATLGLTSTQKTALKAIAKEQGVGVSTMLGNIIDFHFDIYPHIEIIDDLRPHLETIAQNRELFSVLLQTLNK